MFSYIRHSFLHLHNIISPFGRFVKFCVYISILTPTFKEAKLAIFEFIESWYNNTRIHSTLDYKTPNQKYNEYLKNIA